MEPAHSATGTHGTVPTFAGKSRCPRNPTDAGADCGSIVVVAGRGARRPRVVLADDHASVLVAFGRMLEPCCELVASVSHGLDSLEAVSRLKPDVLVVDLMMPDLDGLEVCRRVKKMAPETGVIIVTAFDDPYIQTIALRDGASAFVAKHMAASALEPTVQRVFARATADQASIAARRTS